MSDNRAYFVAIAPDGKIAVVGSLELPATGYDSTGYAFVLARYNGDGTRDGTFGDNGRVVTDLSKYDDFVTAIAVNCRVAFSSRALCAAIGSWWL